ncbi:MAG: PEP-CTERM sorting domain-containing protein [Acidobacteria bacterium]|nr:PEP-CTERM sorting domain-containing protein [Acidobacteriota bacterium]
MKNRLLPLFNKALLLGVAIGAMVIPSFATPTACTTVKLDTLLAGGANADGCQVTDKMFTNFSYAGSLLASQINVTFQSNGPVPAGASITFQPVSGTWSAIDVTFTTTIDAAICPACQFTAVLDSIFTPPTPNANAGTYTHTPGGSINLSGASPAALSGQVIVGGTSVATRFVQTSGDSLQSIQSTFSQQVPEPSTYALMGLGLIGFGLARRLRG